MNTVFVFDTYLFLYVFWYINELIRHGHVIVKTNPARPVCSLKSKFPFRDAEFVRRVMFTRTRINAPSHDALDCELLARRYCFIVFLRFCVSVCVSFYFPSYRHFLRHLFARMESTRRSCVVSSIRSNSNRTTKRVKFTANRLDCFNDLVNGRVFTTSSSAERFLACEEFVFVYILVYVRAICKRTFLATEMTTERPIGSRA